MPEIPFAAPDNQTVEVGGQATVLAPLERMTFAHPLSGSAGENRAALFPYIHASNDLEAVRAEAGPILSAPRRESSHLPADALVPNPALNVGAHN
ncbi:MULTISPECIES: hypothetical protein [Burkholderia cepacia complex]|uniref:hypothetical protein n=1 Tax=Burkholderia cepacia complex TaxID=87882 RepID=UPI001F4B44E8|nr:MULTISPECIES: hypothetical protein [Burkholderia cepacia complex]MDN7775826.1 hypothetical protein [Burkholderia orbicola]